MVKHRQNAQHPRMIDCIKWIRAGSHRQSELESVQAEH